MSEHAVLIVIAALQVALIATLVLQIVQRRR